MPSTSSQHKSVVIHLTEQFLFIKNTSLLLVNRA